MDQQNEKRERSWEAFQAASPENAVAVETATAEEPDWEAGLQNQSFLIAERKRLARRKQEALAAENTKDRLPCFPDLVYSNLPSLLNATVKPAMSDQERDIMLLGSMAVLSSCLPNVEGIYHQNRVFPNLFVFVSASASTGKGRLVRCKDLVMPIHREIREQSEREQQEYQALLAEQETNKGARTPSRPPGEKVLVIPANNSGTGFVEQLANNGGRGLIVEPEADTMSRAFRNEQCAYGESLRKAFHHEPIAYNRRTDKEYVSVEKPALSVLLSGTPRQVERLFEDAEDGLFSRFLFYHMNMDCVWEDVFMKGEDLEQYFGLLGERFHILYRRLNSLKKPLKLLLTEAQKKKFNEFFSDMQRIYGTVKNEYFIASVRRIANSCYRMMLLLAALRLQERENWGEKLELADEDFFRTLYMAEVLVKHAGYIFTGLAEVKPAVLKTQQKERFWNALPEVFNTATYHKIAVEMNIPISTADKDVLYSFKPAGILNHIGRGIFEKVRLKVEP